MSDVLDKVRRFAARNQLLGPSRGVVVAVSGGPDSVALLDMLVRLAREQERAEPGAPPLSLHVAHLDHRLRGQESADDAEFVRALAEKSGLAVTVASEDVRAEARRRRRGIEDVARELRYRFLLATAQRAGCDRIATGHTMTDQAETFLMRLARGASLRGLSSMRPVIAAHSFAEGEVDEGLPAAESESSRTLLIRPLLAVTREEIEAYLRDKGLEYRVDASNEELHYTRNRIRSRVLPALAEINPQVVETLARTAEIVRSDEDALDEIVSSALKRARLESGPGLKQSAYSARALAGQPLAIRRRMIVEAIRELRASRAEARRSSDQITSMHIAAVVALLDTAESGKRVELPGGVEVWREFDRIVFKQGGERPYDLELSRNRPALKAGGLEITLTRGGKAGGIKDALEEARRERVSAGRDWMMVALDDRLLPEKLAVRPRISGERVRIVGRNRTKKLKNLMIDHKIPSSRRDIWPVVATPDGLYVWSPGLPPAQEFAARDETQGLAILRASAI